MELANADRWAATLANADLLWQGFLFTVGVSLLGLVLSLVVGTLLGVLSTTRSGMLRAIARVYVEFFQNTPISVLQMKVDATGGLNHHTVDRLCKEVLIKGFLAMTLQKMSLISVSG